MIVETKSALLGTWFLFTFPSFFGASSFLPKVYSILLVENKLLLPADAAEVITTKLMIPAATGIPIKPNTETNGLLEADSSVHGVILKITNNAPI